VKPGDPNTETDYAIALFYSGDGAAAISTANAVAKANPKFAPVQFNMGVFYAYSGDRASAIKAYEQYIKLEPKGELVAEANSRLAELRSAPAASAGATSAP
jgi:Flp pilus assembly protein TadD